MQAKIKDAEIMVIEVIGDKVNAPVGKIHMGIIACGRKAC